jgi:hypothetical protein
LKSFLKYRCHPVYKLLIDTWMWKLGLRPSNSQKRNKYMRISLQCGANRVSRNTYERGPSLVGKLGYLCQYKRWLSCIIFASPVYYFKLFDPINPSSWAGSRAASPVSVLNLNPFPNHAQRSSVLPFKVWKESELNVNLVQNISWSLAKWIFYPS